MENANDHGYQLKVLAMRVAALEDNVAFLERWCEEQQDTLDRTLGPIGYDYERESEPRKILRVVDLRDVVDEDNEDDEDDAGADDVETIVAVVATDHDRRIRAIHAKLNRLRSRIALTVAPPSEAPPPSPPPPRSAGGRVSAKPASRTAP